MMDWSDVRYFLAMVKAGSLTGAAKELMVSQPTLGRRLDALEEAIGSPVFTRGAGGLLLTATGEALLEHARVMRDEALAIERIATGKDPRLQGTVRITTVEGIGADWLVEKLFPLRQQFPDIELDLRMDEASADLMRREADIAVRMYRPTEPDLIAKKAGYIHYGIYANPDYLARSSPIECLQDIQDHDMVLPTEATLQFVRPMLKKANIKLGRRAFCSNSSTALINATRHGYGLGLHSSLTAVRHPELVPVLPEIRQHSGLWLVTHSDIHRSARIRAVFDYLNEVFAEYRRDLARLEEKYPDSACEEGELVRG